MGEEGRLSYVLWEEDNVVPLLALEVVSKTDGGEYERKKEEYARLGILYYVVYASNRPSRRKRQPLEVYRLINGNYVLQPGDRVWMPEIGLAIGREQGIYQGWQREWLYWYDQEGCKLPTPEERAERLAQKLRELGIDPSEV